MKPYVAALAIVLFAVAPSTAQSATVRLPLSPATLAMSPVNSGEVHLTNVTLNRGAITSPVAPGSAVRVEFDWSLSAVPGCPLCAIQIYVGFQGKPASCVVVATAGITGHTSLFLTAPTTVGNQLVMVNETVEADCVSVTSGGGGLASVVGVVVTKR